MSEQQRLLWQCRRGMLELDELLSHFVRQHYQQLSSSEQQNFEELLQEPDPHISDWIFNHQPINKPHLTKIVALLKEQRVTTQ